MVEARSRLNILSAHIDPRQRHIQPNMSVVSWLRNPTAYKIDEHSQSQATETSYIYISSMVFRLFSLKIFE